MRVRATIALLFASGCAQIFGIDNTSKAPDAAPPATSSLAIIRHSIGATIVDAPQTTVSLAPAIFFSDNMPIASTTDGTTWSAPVLADSVEFFLPDYPMSIPRVFAIPVADVRALFGVLEHPGAAIAPPSASIGLGVSLPTAVVAGESYQLVTVGSWSQTVLAPAAGAVTLTDAVPFTGNSTVTGRPLEGITTDDAVLVVRYTGDELTALLDVPPFTMVDGVNSITGGMAPIAIDQNLAATIDPTTAAGRLAIPQPTNGPPALDWSLVAAPGFEVANTNGIQLRAGAAAATDTSVAVPYGNPFTARNWHPAFTWAPTSSRTATVGTLPVTMFAQLVDILDAGTGAITADLPAGLPLVTTLAGTPLTTDNTVVTADPTMPLTVSFTADNMTNTLYQLQVFELVPNATSTALQYQIAMSLTAVQPEFTLPPNTLATGKNYTLRAICIAGGYPSIAQGDLTARTLPFSLGFADRGAFSVMSP